MKMRHEPLSSRTTAWPSRKLPHPDQLPVPTNVYGPLRLGAVACSTYLVVSCLVKAW